MKKMIMIAAVAILHLGAFGALAQSDNNVKEAVGCTCKKVKNGTVSTFDKTKAGAKDVYNKAKDGTVKAYDKTKNGTKKVYEKAKAGTVKAYDKTKDGAKKLIDDIKKDEKK